MRNSPFLIVGLFLVLLAFFASAQVIGPSTPPSGEEITDETINTSPTPIGGYTTFTSDCAIGSFKQNVVCTASPCNASSPFVCKSNFSLGNLHECAAPVSVSEWGWNSPMHSACCDVSGNCSPIGVSDKWVGGVTTHAAITPASSVSGFDPRGFKIVRRTSTSWVAVFNTSSNAQITTTSDGGATWTSPFSIKSLFSQSDLPNGVSYSNSNVSAVNPSIALNPDSSVELVFEVRDGVGSPAKSNIYFSRCTTTSCSSSANWQSAIPILPSLTTETCSDSICTWLRSLASPKVVVDSSGRVHVLFDDADLSSNRINGIFHRFCDSISSCNILGDWSQSVNGPDILNDSGNGFARSPHLAVFDSDVVAVWLDNSTVGNPSSTTIFASRYSPGANVWAPFVPVSPSGNYLSPHVSMGDERLLVSSLNNSLVSVFECPGACFSDLSSPSQWSDVTSNFDRLNSLSSIRDVAVVVSPFNANEAVVLATGQQGSNVQQLFGAYFSNGVKVGPRQLVSTTNPFTFYGLSDVSGASALQTNPDTFSLLQFFGGTSASGRAYSSTIFSSANANPSGNLSAPTTPTTWQSLGNVSFSGSTTFYVRDTDAGDSVYASAFLSYSPTSLDFPIRTFVDLRSLQGLTGSESCSGTNGFTSLESCTLDLPLYDPSTGLSVPDGQYYLVLVLNDSRGGSYTISTPNQITVDLSNVLLSVLSPLSNSTWAGTGTHMFVMNVAQSKFVQSLDLVARGTLGNASIDLVSIPISSFGTVSPSCLRNGSDYNCTSPFVSNPSIPEGSYTILVDVLQDGFLSAGQTISNVVLDFVGPRLVSSLPAGTITSPPASVSFILNDFSSISTAPQVTINGNTATPSCSLGSQTVSCTAPFPSSISEGQVSVNIVSIDSRGNSSQPSFSFMIGSAPPCTGPDCGGGTGGGSGGGGGGGGGGGPSVIPDIKDLIDKDGEGNVIVKGTPITIPRTVVETIGGFSNDIVFTTNNLVDVTGPSSNAIFLGLCVIAGLASDVVFRRVFTKVRADIYQQRERLVRVLLAGIFFSVPLGVGWFFSLAAGFIFTVMEIVGFVAAAYLFKLLQYYDTFGYKPISSASLSGEASPPISQSLESTNARFGRPPL